MWDKHSYFLFFLVNNNTYYNTHENKYSNKYYCLLKKENRDIYPTLIMCVQCPLFITSIYNYKGQTLLQLYFGYIMYYKLGLKHYYCFRVCSNKYYYLLKKKKNRDVYPTLVVRVQRLLFRTQSTTTKVGSFCSCTLII